MKSLFVTAVKLIGVYHLYDTVSLLVVRAGFQLREPTGWGAYFDNHWYDWIWLLGAILLIVLSGKIANLLRVRSTSDFTLSLTEFQMMRIGIVVVGVYAFWVQLLGVPNLIQAILPAPSSGPSEILWNLPYILRFVWICIPVWIILSADPIARTACRCSAIEVPKDEEQ